VIAARLVVAGQVVEARELVFEVIDPSRLRIEALAYDAALASDVAAASVAIGPQRLALRFVGAARSLRDQALPLQFALDPPRAAAPSSTRRPPAAAVAHWPALRWASRRWACAVEVAHHRLCRAVGGAGEEPFQPDHRLVKTAPGVSTARGRRRAAGRHTGGGDARLDRATV
jgi:hypothetical protein